MTRTLLLLSLAWFQASAFAVTQNSGSYYVCSTSDDSVKLTADLSSVHRDRVAVVTIDGMPKAYWENRRWHLKHLFLIGAVKNSTFQVKRTAKSAALISLETDPKGANAQVAHQGDGIVVTKFDAILTVPGLQVDHKAVSCLETNWVDQGDHPTTGSTSGSAASAPETGAVDGGDSNAGSSDSSMNPAMNPETNPMLKTTTKNMSSDGEQ